MVKPLGLPVGSVRAILLLALGARCVLELRAHHTIPAWLVVATLIAAASYFAGRAASPKTDGGERPRRAPWGLPRGTIRVVFLVLAGYGTYLWFTHHQQSLEAFKAFWPVLGYAVGLLAHFIVTRRRPGEEAAATYFEHILALVAILSAGGLVWLGVDSPVDPEQAASYDWVEPLLAAIVVHYFGTR